MERTPRPVFFAAPRGFCAGVQRTIEMVEGALLLCGAPVYARIEVARYAQAIATLTTTGAVFIDNIADAPPEGRIKALLSILADRYVSAVETIQTMGETVPFKKPLLCAS